MARPRKLPDADELHRLRIVEGKTYEEIAQLYGVTKAAVHLALRKSNLVTPRSRWRDEIPWLVAVEHSDDYRVSMLRLAARLRHGRPVPEHRARYVNNWMDNLAKPREGAPLGVVVDYDRDFYPGGFAYVARTAEDDWIIRAPEAEEKPSPKGRMDAAKPSTFRGAVQLAR